MKKRVDRKRVLREFSYLECDAFADYLHDMSLKGWHFQGWKFGLIFERGEPEDITYVVEVFSKGSEMDTRPEPEAEEFAEYCQAAGWRFLDSDRRFCVFRKEDDGAVPIVTPQERLRNVCKAQWRNLTGYLTAGLLATGNILVQFMSGRAAEWLFHPVLSVILLGACVLTAGELLRCAWLFVWKAKRKRRLAEGREIVYKRDPGNKVWTISRNVWLILIVIISLNTLTGEILAAFIGVLTAVAFAAAIAYFRPSRAENWALQIAGGIVSVFVIGIIIVSWVFLSDGTGGEGEEALDKLPLIQSDYGEAEGKACNIEYDYNETIMGSRTYGNVEFVKDSDYENTDYLSYEICRSKFPWLLDMIWQKWVEGLTPSEECKNEWDSEKAYETERVGKLIYIRYSNAIVSIEMKEEPDEMQISIIRDKMGLGA